MPGVLASPRGVRGVPTTPVENLSDFEVAPHEAEPAFEGASLIHGAALLTPEEDARSARTIERRDSVGAAKTAVMLNFAVIMAALSYVLFTAPNNLALGGASGLSIVIAALVPGCPMPSRSGG